MDETLFFSWLDGELDADAAAKVEARVASDPELQRKAAAHRSMQARLKSAFEPVLTAPSAAGDLPSPQAGNLVDLAAARSRRSQRRALPSMPQWAAIAATLVVGIVTGTMIRGPEPLARTEAGQLAASGELGRALDTRLASAPAATGPQIGLTFRDRSGSICRSFTNGAAQGFACRNGGTWTIRALVQGANAGSGDYRMAAGADPALGALIDSRIAGEPFDSAAERDALAKGWR